MGLITGLLTLPLAPVRGTVWIAEQLTAEAERELREAQSPRRRLIEAERPTLIEARTYRTRGHVETEHTFLSTKYRDDAEVEAWKARDPIASLASALTDRQQVPTASLEAIRDEVKAEVDAAYASAAEAPWPQSDEAFRNMFA